MRIIKCNAQGEPIDEFIDWYMPWLLLFTTFALASMACIILVIECVENFMCGVPKASIIKVGFRERMYMAVTEVPDYARHVRRCKEAYGKRMS